MNCNQAKMKEFRDLHQTLKHSPLQLYTEDLAVEKDYLLDSMRQYRKKKVDLSSSDPSPEMVAKIQRQVAKARTQREQMDQKLSFLADSPSAPSASISTSALASSHKIPSSTPEGDLLHGQLMTFSPAETSLMSGSVTYTYRQTDPLEPLERPPSDQLLRKSGSKPRSSQPDSSQFSSTLTALQMTKKGVQDQVQSLSEYGLYIPGSIDLKRTITKIFANPKHAEEISKSEYDRRQRVYEEEKKRVQQQMAAQLAKERQLLQTEIDRFSH